MNQLDDDRESKKRKDRAAALSEKIFTIEDERTADIPPRTWFIDGMLTPGFNLLTAKKGIGKSFFALQAAVAIAGGKPFLGRETTQAPTLLVTTEIDRIALHERVQRFGEMPPSLFVSYGWTAGDQALYDAEIVIQEHGIRVLVFDMFLPILQAGMDTNAYETSAIFLKWRLMAQKHGAAILAVWHAGKTERTDFMDSALGTTGITGQSDCILSLDRKRGESKAKLYIGGNHGAEEVLSLSFENCMWELAEGSASFLTANDEALIGAVKKHPEGVGPTTVAAAIGKSYDSTRMALARLAERGLIAREGKGLYKPLTEQTEHPPNISFMFGDP